MNENFNPEGEDESIFTFAIITAGIITTCINVAGGSDSLCALFLIICGLATIFLIVMGEAD